MTPPVTPHPNCFLELDTAANTILTWLFGVIYITLTGLINSMISFNGTWALLDKFLSYIVKLASILWWAFPSMNAVPPPANPPKLTKDWLPDSFNFIDHINDTAQTQQHSHQVLITSLFDMIVSCPAPKGTLFRIFSLIYLSKLLLVLLPPPRFTLFNLRRVLASVSPFLCLQYTKLLQFILSLDVVPLC
ncbi:hypothetical protein DSO57_1008073 [Entomophthora muscae]|uniref:Uncharacterized protein n=1 Tax=Entomophthora muscae TaxID=34485 RepID=A0ACC2S992_9FUNG|nr:hypothetical protein DSO57_1008073 [Entomophthora muscae]